MRKRQIKNLVGQQFGQLTVLRRAVSNTFRQAVWVCRCSCGNETNVVGSNLRHSTRSCGCLKRGKQSLPEGEASFNDLLGTYKRSAKKRGYEWGLLDEQVKDLTKKPCHYCGVEPKQTWKPERHTHGAFVYNGLDRVDNSKGYIVENVVPCCEACNRAKLARSPEEYREWIKRSYEHLFNEV